MWIKFNPTVDDIISPHELGDLGPMNPDGLWNLFRELRDEATGQSYDEAMCMFIESTAPEWDALRTRLDSLSIEMPFWRGLSKPFMSLKTAKKQWKRAQPIYFGWSNAMMLEEDDERPTRRETDLSVLVQCATTAQYFVLRSLAEKPCAD